MAFIRNEEINQIRQSADIVEVISEYLPLTKKGKNFVAVCPFHDDHSPSLVVSPERQIFNCFTCRTGGNVFAFLMKYENITFTEAVATVAKKIGYNIKIDSIEEDSKYKKEYQIMDLTTKYFINNINTKDGIKAKQYLSSRGIDDLIIKEFNIGLALNNKDTLYQLLIKNNYSLDEIESLGLVNKSGINVFDTFTNRIMIPIENLSGKVVGFTGRIFNDEDQAKYINTKETTIFKKGDILFNYHNARKYIRDEKKVIVVEGNMDAIKVSASGIKNVVALMGVALSKTQMNVLRKLNVPVILMLDNDSAGLDATVKLGQLLMDNKIDCQIVRLSGAKDPDEYIREKGVEALLDNINHAKKYIDFKLEYLKNNKNLNNIEDVIAYVKEVISSLKNSDDLSKEIVLSKISKDYNIDINILKKNINIKETSLPVEKKEIKNKKSRYEIAVSKVLYAMMSNGKYITIYKNKLGYFNDKIDRIIASEIVYYNNENSINIADFVSFVMTNEEIYDKVLTIISQNEGFDVSDEEFNNCIDVLLELRKIDEIKEIKEQIKNEMDENKKFELLARLTEIKKGSVDNE